MIVYNKKLQKILLSSIKDLKRRSGKYKFSGKNGKGKVYIMNKNILLFEGEYLDGRKKGKGKDYESIYGKLIFEGEYLKGERNEKGKNIIKMIN